MQNRRLSFSQYFRWWLYVLNKPSNISSQEFLQSQETHKRSVERYLSRQRKKPCYDCQKFISGLMSLDHLPQFPKSFDFKDAQFYPFKAVMKEVAKTQTVCRPCHDLREEYRLQEIRRKEPPEQVAFSKFFTLVRLFSGAYEKKLDRSYRKHRNRNTFYRKIFGEEPEDIL